MRIVSVPSIMTDAGAMDDWSTLIRCKVEAQQSMATARFRPPLLNQLLVDLQVKWWRS